MTVGLHAVNLANRWLDMLAGTAFSAPTNTYAKLHTGDPGSAGTSNASAETTRKQLSWSAASSGSKALSSTAAWTSWTAGAETLTHVSVWDASTSGNFLFSAAFSSSKSVGNGDTLNLTALTIALTPLAA